MAKNSLSNNNQNEHQTGAAAGSQAAIEFLSDFRLFDNQEVIPLRSDIVYAYYPVSEASALRLKGIMDNKGFNTYNEDNRIYMYWVVDEEAAGRGFSYIDVFVGINNEYSNITLCLRADNRLVTFSDFDAMFGNTSGNVSDITIYQEYDQNMTSKFNEYYQNFAQTDFEYCNTDNNTFWHCEKGGNDRGQPLYIWSAAYDIDFSVYYLEQSKSIVWTN